MNLIPEDCIEELKEFDPIIISLSGGTQSTAIAIDLYNQNIEARMVFFDTGIESKKFYLKHFKGQSFCGELNHSIEDFLS